ncbi:hypothetical protein CBS147330_4820 [Penicillium roqueforti]|nr:hypothetical protein CBS147330_4820 [Penicillium roqueforti]
MFWALGPRSKKKKRDIKHPITRWSYVQHFLNSKESLKGASGNSVQIPSRRCHNSCFAIFFLRILLGSQDTTVNMSRLDIITGATRPFQAIPMNVQHCQKTLIQRMSNAILPLNVLKDRNFCVSYAKHIYIFIAYTTIQFSHDQKRDDMEVLHSIAEKAARRAGVQVYWLACSCKTWSAQPWLFGFEGYLPTHEIEALVIVVNMNRLAWTGYSSQLSRHCMVDGECIGRNPTEDPKVKRIVDSSAYATREAAGVSAPLWKRGWYAPRSTLFL